jgi:hypothetical protein
VIRVVVYLVLIGFLTLDALRPSATTRPTQ